jgi:hypothetical protein
MNFDFLKTQKPKPKFNSQQHTQKPIGFKHPNIAKNQSTKTHFNIPSAKAILPSEKPKTQSPNPFHRRRWSNPNPKSQTPNDGVNKAPTQTTTPSQHPTARLATHCHHHNTGNPITHPHHQIGNPKPPPSRVAIPIGSSTLTENHAKDLIDPFMIKIARSRTGV